VWEKRRARFWRPSLRLRAKEAVEDAFEERRLEEAG
jgi:hypothetical protein